MFKVFGQYGGAKKRGFFSRLFGSKKPDATAALQAQQRAVQQARAKAIAQQRRQQAIANARAKAKQALASQPELQQALLAGKQQIAQAGIGAGMNIAGTGLNVLQSRLATAAGLPPALITPPPVVVAQPVTASTASTPRTQQLQRCIASGAQLEQCLAMIQGAQTRITL